jgi:hypothetical protein
MSVVNSASKRDFKEINFINNIHKKTEHLVEQKDGKPEL